MGHRGLGAPAMVMALSGLIFGRFVVGGSAFAGFGSGVLVCQKWY